MFWPKEIGSKADRTMLMKLTIGVNFTTLLRAAFEKSSMQIFNTSGPRYSLFHLFVVKQNKQIWYSQNFPSLFTFFG